MSLPMEKVIDDTKELVGWKIRDVLYKGGYDSTEFINSDGVSLQEEVTTMINEGQKTIVIVAEYVDKTELNKILDNVSKLVETDYSSASWQELQKVVAELDNLTKQSEIDSKITEIQNAIDNLRVDVSKLDELLERIENMNKDVYTKDTLDNLIKVVDSMEEYTKQYEVDEKVAELEEALKNLKLDPEKVQIKKGDLDKNGIVNANDAAIALDLYKYGNVSDEDMLIGDMDNNGIINANDAALILDIYKYGN